MLKSASRGGVCSQGGVCSMGSALGGCLLWGVCSGGCLLWGGVCSWGWGCLLLGCLLLGVSAPGVVCSQGGGVCPMGGCLLLGGSAPGGYALRQIPLPVNRMTNRCKNITLATTSLRPVIKNTILQVLQFMAKRSFIFKAFII